MENDERIKKEIKKFKRIFKNLNKDKKEIVEKLINNAAFMAVSLEDLQMAIRQNGYICEYRNSENQWGTKINPESNLYNTMVKNYSAVVKQLIDMLPKDDAKTAKDELVTFIQKVSG